MSGRACVLVVAPELHARDGGVQMYGRTLVRALLAVLPGGAGLEVFARNDAPGAASLQPRGRLVGCGSRSGVLAELRLSLAVLRAARSSRPALIVSTHPQFAPLLWMAGRISGATTWCACHGIDVWQLRPGLRRWALRRLDCLLPVSRFTRDQLQRQLGRSCPVLTVLPNSFDARRFSPGPRPPQLLRRYGLQPDQPVVFCLTRLSSTDRYKRVDALIEALPSLQPHVPGLLLVIGGCGDDRSRLEALVCRHGLSDAVVFAGAIADDELVDHYRLATVFALPSEGEGFGIVFLEAMGCGCPVLAGDRDASPDPLGDGAYGLLVDPRQPLAPPLLALLQRQGQSLWFDPVRLSRAVADRFGFEALCSHLRQLLPPLS